MTNLIQFVHEDSDLLVKEIKADLEKALNVIIAPADVLHLVVNAIAYRELIVRAAINHTGRQNMVSFSRGVYLDYLAELVGVYRLPASKATITVRFTLVTGHTGVVIPEGLRVGSIDGKVIFRTVEETVVNAGTLTADVKMICDVDGVIGNGYDINTIVVILDPQPFLTAAYNITKSEGGNEIESDEELRERISLAPNQYSVAGSRDAYIYHAKSAHPGVVDVEVSTPEPGTVNIYPLLEGGVMPGAEVLDLIEEIVSGDKVRPLTDTVAVLAPEAVDYDIEVDITVLTNAVPSTVQSGVLAALQQYKEDRKNKLALDVVLSDITARAKIAGVYDVEVVSPLANIVAGPDEYTRCGTITVNIAGIADE